MTFAIKPKNCDDYKDIVHLDNKEQALEYFSTRIKLDKKKLLELYEICVIHH